MSKREQWEFRYGAGDVAAAAKAQARYHRERQKHWDGERLNAENALRENGIEIRHHQVTGGVQATAMLDPEKANWMAKCADKAEQHKRQAEEYENWTTVLSRHKTDQFDLHASDVLYFWPPEVRDS